jgi:hypothetical protein
MESMNARAQNMYSQAHNIYNGVCIEWNETVSILFRGCWFIRRQSRAVKNSRYYNNSYS